MKWLFILYVLSVGATLACHAQDTDKEATLQGVEVKGARIVNKADGRLYYPTDSQKGASATGYDLMQKLALPNILVDETAHTVSAVNNKGEVQLRINNIKADKAEMLALDPQTISRIDFIDNPGVRYDENIAYVINIITVRNDYGHTIGTNLSQAVTTAKGDYTAFGKWNKGNGELSLSYDFDYADFRGNRTEETANYTLSDGSIYTITRNDTDTRSRDFGNTVHMAYNLADSANYVFQVSLEAAFSNTPGDYSLKQIADGAASLEAVRRNKSHDCTPSFDLYYHRQLTERQTVTLNAVGTYIGTSAVNSYDEGAPYCYSVEGRTSSLVSEAIYENRLKLFTLSAGVNHKLKYTRNEYTGDVSALNTMHSSTLYTFTQLRGRIGKFSYVAGVGLNNLHYRQQEHNYDFLLFRPKMSVAYNLTDAWHLNYDFEVNSYVSKIAMVSDAVIRNNSMEWTLGNPDLRPNRVTRHTLRLSYDKPRWSSFVKCFYQMHDRPNMAVYERTADNRFIYTQRNQRAINFLLLSAYFNYWLVPERLTIMSEGTMNRCMNFGNDYTHCLTSWDGMVSLNAYLGKLTLSAYTTSGWHFMEGETKGYNGAYTSLKAAYKHKNCQFSLTWHYPFQNNSLQYKTEIVSRYINKTMTQYSQDYANYLSLSVTWRLNKGRHYHKVDRTVTPKDSETGIMKQ